MSLAASAGSAQLNLPQVVTLPDEDFVFQWGRAGVDEQRRPDFTVRGVEQSFSCVLTGSFRPGSRMRDFYNQREFEQELAGTLDFIQASVYRLNQLDRSNDLDWALLDCYIPETVESDDEQQQRIDRALERAERQRERRRARNADDD